MLSASGASPLSAPSSLNAGLASANVFSGERRQLTVAFIDLVASTDLAAQLDPEDFQSLLQTYHEAVAAEVERYGGHVAQLLGDGVLVYFGWPAAQERAAEMAVHAALRAVSAVAGIQAPTGPMLRARVGVATGLVVVKAGPQNAQHRDQPTAVGDTPHLAARLQGLAQPGGIVIAAATRGLVGDSFELESLDVPNIKGFAAAGPVYRVLGPRSGMDSAATEHSGDPLPLVGRDRELRSLLERWHVASTGVGQVVEIIGEPGIGKSRLVKALEGSLRDENYETLRFEGSRLYTHTALHPVTEEFSKRAGVEADAPPEMRLTKLDRMIALHPISNHPNTVRRGTDDRRVVDVAAALADLFNVPQSSSGAASQLEPNKRMERILDALVEVVAATACAAPLLVVAEDAHWFDPTSNDFVTRLMSRAASLPILIVRVSRPAATALCAELPRACPADTLRMTLGALGKAPTRTLVDHLCGSTPLPDDLVEQILARADGTPLFAEELTKAVLEAQEGGAIIEPAKRHRAGDPSSLPTLVPATLHDTLLARLDRLGEAKTVAQAASVIGRHFEHGLLGGILSLPEPAVQAALEGLITADLLRVDPASRTYRFKHALLCDAAYHSLLKSTRATLHASVAKCLETDFPEIASREPALLAYHYERAGADEQAHALWLEAGRRAFLRSNLAEAKAQVIRAEQLLSAIAEGTPRDSAALNVQIELGRISLASVGHAAQDTGHAYLQAALLCKRLDVPVVQRLPVLLGLWMHRLVRGDLDLARPITEEIGDLARETGDETAAVMGYVLTGIGDFFKGDFASSKQALKSGLEWIELSEDILAASSVQDRRITVTNCLAETYLCLGDIELARRLEREGLLLARTLDQPFTLGHALHSSNLITALRCETRNEALTLLAQADEVAALGAQYGLYHYEISGGMMRGRALTLTDNAGRGADALSDAVAAFRAMGARLDVPLYLAWQGEAEWLAGRSDGLGLLTEADALSRTTQQNWARAEIYRIHARLLRAKGDSELAATRLREAAVIARQQGARHFERRIARDQAELGST